MKHFILVYYILSFTSGAVSVAFVLINLFKRRDVRFLRYLLFLLSLTVLVILNAYQFYRYHISAFDLGYARFFVHGVFSVTFAAMTTLVPALTFDFAGRKMPRPLAAAAVAASVISVLVTAGLYVANPDAPSRLSAEMCWLYGFQINALFAVVIVCLVYLLVRLLNEKQRERRRLIGAAFVMTILFFPGFILDANWRTLQLAWRVLPMGFNFTPLFYLVWNVLSLVALAGFLTPVHAPNGTLRPLDVPGLDLPEGFIREHGISPQEKTVLVMALNGMANPQIAEKLFISPGTVKNHMHNIYTKTGAKNRIDLARQIKEFN